MKTGITGGFGVSGENNNGRRLIDFYDERGLYVSSTYLKHKNLHKYTRVARMLEKRSKSLQKRIR